MNVAKKDPLEFLRWLIVPSFFVVYTIPAWIVRYGGRFVCEALLSAKLMAAVDAKLVENIGLSFLLCLLQAALLISIHLGVLMLVIFCCFGEFWNE